MIKDIIQKQKAIRFCVANGIIPYLEVLVRYGTDIGETECDISDIDVLGVYPASIQGSSRVIFDCKTQQKVSAIGRALWVGGLMKFVEAKEAYVILNRKAPEGHRLAANQMGIRLTSEVLFDNFGSTASPNYAEGFTYLDCLDGWKDVAVEVKKQPGLAALVHFLNHTCPLESDPCKGVRTLLQVLKHAEGELDATKPVHRALWGFLICEATRFLSEVAIGFHHVFDPEMGRVEFERLLRNYIWGGKESYLVRQKLHSALRSNREDTVSFPFELPGWERFVELMRSLMDAPHLVSSGIIPLKDLSFSNVCSERRGHADARIKSEFSANLRARQYPLLINKYLGSLSRLLKDCSDHYTELLTAS